MKARRLDTRSMLPFWNQEIAPSSQRWQTLAELFNDCSSLSVPETPIMAGFMKKSLTFETRKWRRQFVFFWRCRGATVVAMSETANCHLLFLKILFGFCKRESSSLFFVDFIVVVEEIYTSDLWSVTFAKSERTIFAFFS